MVIEKVSGKGKNSVLKIKSSSDNLLLLFRRMNQAVEKCLFPTLSLVEMSSFMLLEGIRMNPHMEQ